MQHAIARNLEQTVQKHAAKCVVDQTKPATTSMGSAPQVALMDIKDKDVRIVSLESLYHVLL